MKKQRTKKDPILVKLERQFKYHKKKAETSALGSKAGMRAGKNAHTRSQMIQGYKNWGEKGLNAPAVWDAIRDGNKAEGTWNDEKYALVNIDGQWYAIRNGEMRLATVDLDGNIIQIDEDNEVLYAE